MIDESRKKAGRRIAHAFIAALLTTTIAILPALALPPIGTPIPRASVQSVGGQQFKLHETRGKTTLIFYENKDVVDQNRALKSALEKQKKEQGYARDVQIVAVADVSAWDFWPAKGFVKDAIREEEKKAGHPIFLDWTGAFGRAMRVDKDASNVVLVGPDRRVTLSHAGPVPAGKALQILMATGK